MFKSGIQVIQNVKQDKNTVYIDYQSALQQLCRSAFYIPKYNGFAFRRHAK